MAAAFRKRKRERKKVPTSVKQNEKTVESTLFSGSEINRKAAADFHFLKQQENNNKNLTRLFMLHTSVDASGESEVKWRNGERVKPQTANHKPNNHNKSRAQRTANNKNAQCHNVGCSSVMIESRQQYFL